jgi:SAM-dependent methyltransferase
MSEWSKRAVAEEWKRAAAERAQHLAPATAAMFDLARVAPGMRVLELGTGAGDVALMAAERVGGAGSVVATDGSEEMVAAAAASVREAAATNVTVRRMRAETIDFPAATFDVVLARMVLMFVDDLPKTLAGVARVLVPGGRLGATVWSTIANNPYHAAILDVAGQSGPFSQPVPELVRAFGLSDRGKLVEAAGGELWTDVEVRVVRGERRVASLTEQIATQRRWPLVADLFAALDEASRARAWSEIERRWRSFEVPGGGAVFPTEILVLGASSRGDAG